MKKIFLIIFLIVTQFILGQSPTKQGRINLNGNLFYMTQETVDPNNNLDIFLFNPQFGYFIIDNLSVNISIDYTYETFRENSSTKYGIGPSIRYYFDIEKIKPYLSIGYSYLGKITTSYGYTDKFPSQELLLSGGLDYFITNNVALETIISYRITTVEEQLYSTAEDIYIPYNKKGNTFLIGLGINIFL